jgi:hypothetical protein
VFCDWPCNLQSVYACPAHKTIFMRDRQPTGNVGQREVLEATCSSAQIPKAAVGMNNITPEPVAVVTPEFYPSPSPHINNIPQQLSPAGK